MKFEWKDKALDMREPVAYINRQGNLVIKTSLYSGVYRSNIPSHAKTGTLIHRGRVESYTYSWQPFDLGVLKRFYPGDKLTITF